MNMKKIASGIVAAVMAAGLCIPAFAEATPGQVANDSANTVIGLTQNWKADASNAEKAKAEMENMVDQLQDNSATVSTVMTSAGLSYYDALEENGQPGEDYHQAGSYDGEVQWKVRYAIGGNFTSGTEFVTYSADTDTITVDAEIIGAQSPTGYAITVYLPDDAAATQYSVKMLGDNAQPNDSVVPVNSYVEEDGTVQKYVSFWVPHFTTYQLTPVGIPTEPEQPVQPEQPAQEPAVDEHPEIADAIANGTWGQGSEAAAQSGSTGAAAAGENPIKRTGAAMDLTVFVMIAAAAAAVCGVGVAAKKFHKG